MAPTGVINQTLFAGILQGIATTASQGDKEVDVRGSQRHKTPTSNHCLMSAKAFLMGAVFAVGITLSATAQTNPVYSVNAVGYVKLNLKAGFTMISNPLNAGTNNLNTLLPVVPTGTIIYRFMNGGYDPNPPIYLEGAGWLPDGNATLAPGQGAFIYSPFATNVVFAGEVLQGNLTNPIPSGFGIVSSQVPQAATLSSLGYPAEFGDTVYIFDSQTQQYNVDTPIFIPGTGWTPGDTNGPIILPGQSFWIFNQGAPKNWTRSFSVNQ